LLVGQQEGHPACKTSGGVLVCLSGARCRLAHGPADATVDCFSKIFYLSGEFCTFDSKSLRQMGHMMQLTILLVTSPDVYRF